jgi:hypothetical protein
MTLSLLLKSRSSKGPLSDDALIELARTISEDVLKVHGIKKADVQG